MEAKCSSETSVDFQRATPRYISEDRNLHNLRLYIQFETARNIIIQSAAITYSSMDYGGSCYIMVLT
jgi:hypothetical protein